MSQKTALKFTILCIMALVIGSSYIGCGKKVENVNTNNLSEIEKEIDTDEKNEENKIDLGGRKVIYAAWYDLKPKPQTLEGTRKLKRISELEEKYNFKFEFLEEPGEKYLEKIIVSTLAGDPIADFIDVKDEWFMTTLVRNGVIYPASDLKAFNFNEPKWQPLYKEVSTYKGKIYGLHTGRIAPRSGMFWNKTIFKREGLPDLYELQKRGEWTWDKMIEIAKKATKDIDNDGTIDQWGLCNSIDFAFDFIYSNNASVIKLNGDKANFSLDDPNAIEALQAYSNVFKENIAATMPKGSQWDWFIKLFQDGKVAMLPYQWFSIGDYKKFMKDDYGFVMFPKGPKATDYVSQMSSMTFPVMPATVKNPEELAVIWNEFTEPYPDEKENEWKEHFLSLSKDKETVEETVVSMVMHNKSVYNPTHALGLGDLLVYSMFPRILNEKTAPVFIVEEYKQKVESILNEALNKNINK